MEKIAQTAKKFITKLNKNIKKSNDSKPDKDFYKELLENIREIKSKYSYDESVITKYLDSKEKKVDKQNLLALVLDGEIKAILGKSCKNHQLEKINPLDLKCNHQIETFKFSTTDKIHMVDNRVSFESMLSSLDFYLIDVYDHSYRTYNPFVCFVVLLSTEGVFIVDCVKIRHLIIESGLFTCKYKKIFPNVRSYKKLLVDFKNITCFKIGNLYFEEDFLLFQDYKITSETYIDWRIEYLQFYLKSFMNQRICKFQSSLEDLEFSDFPFYVESDSDFLYLEKDTDLYYKSFKEYFVYKYWLKDDEYLDQLIRAREIYAKNNNESIYYVMTNDQLSIFAKLRFKNEREMMNHEMTCSSIVKQNLGAFVFAK